MDGATLKREKTRLQRDIAKVKKERRRKTIKVNKRKYEEIKHQIDMQLGGDISNMSLRKEVRETNTLNCWDGTDVFEGGLQEFG